MNARESYTQPAATLEQLAIARTLVQGITN